MTNPEFNSDHVIIWYLPFQVKSSTNNQKVTFEFMITTRRRVVSITWEKERLIKACGVCPIYDSQYHSFLQQNKSREAIGS